MAEMVQVDPELVKQMTGFCRRNVLQRPVYNFYAELARRDSPLSPGVLSPDASTAVNSYEHFLGTAAAFKDSIKKNGLLSGSYSVKDEFVELFSFFVGAAAGMSLVDKVKKIENPHPVSGKHTINFGKGETSVLDDLVTTYLNGTSRAQSGETLLSQTKDYYQWILNQGIEQHKEQKFADLIKQAEAAHIKVNGIVINGFQYRSFDKMQTTPAAYRREDYVGNTELLDTLGRALVELLDYDFKQKKNPNMELGGFQQTMTVWGEGGMGKSMGIAIALNEAKEKANRAGVPFFVRELRGFKSEYYAKSAQNLREIFEDIRKGDAIYAIVAEDIDTIFYAREELKNRPEDKEVLGELMNQLEGMTSNTLGNYVFIATSNHPLQGDGPLMDRLRQCQIHVKGPQSAEEYANVFKAKLRDGVNAKYITVKNWDAIGKYAQNCKFSNRDIRNICLDVLSLTKNYKRPDNFHTMGYAEKVAYLRSNRRQCNDEGIIQVITAYEQGVHEQRQKEFEAEVAGELHRFSVVQEVEKRLR